MKRTLLILAFCFPIFLLAQANFRLSIELYQQHNLNPKEVKKLMAYKKQHPTDRLRNRELQSTYTRLLDAGYLSASIDSIRSDSQKNELTAFIHVGNKYRWAYIKKGNVDEEILSKIGFREKIYFEKTLKANEVQQLFTRTIEWCENNGYPFATVKLDSVSIGQEKVSAVLNLDKNKLFTIDSIQLEGDPKIGLQYISNYLGMKKGDPYNEEAISTISTRIQELPFVAETQPHKIIFSEKDTRLILFLKRQKASRFNGVAGILPDENTGKILITGDVKLDLRNAFGQGETTIMNWRKLQNNTQDLVMHFNYPFLFNTSFGLDANLKLYRRDTLFSSFDRDLGLQFFLEGGNYFKIFVGRSTSGPISTEEYKELTVPPPFLDLAVTSYGIGTRAEKLDYRLNPRKGIRIDFNGSVGSREIRKNPNLNQVIYDSLDLKTIQYKGTLDAEYFIPLWKRSSFMIGNLSGFLYSENLFTNELYRIGGLKTLRGFDEESINASAFSVLTLEYRYLLEQNSYFYVFWDGAYYEDQSDTDSRVIDRPFGFGSGVSFETRAGIFSINYALGKQLNNPIQLRAAKIHFGFLSFF